MIGTQASDHHRFQSANAAIIAQANARKGFYGFGHRVSRHRIDLRYIKDLQRIHGCLRSAYFSGFNFNAFKL